MYDLEIEEGTATCLQCDIIINEIDYDQGTQDNAEFIELYNPCGMSIDLSSYSIELVNGANSSTYSTYNLSGTISSGGYYVICTNSANTPNCDLDVSPNSNVIQDGAPDAIALLNGTILIDALSYEGDVPGTVEGTGVGLIDDGITPNFGLSRFPNGVDSDDNATDFDHTLATPGAENIDVEIPFTNPTLCQLGESIPDDNCDVTNEYAIQVTGLAASQLGTDVDLRSVDLIIEHTWAADLDISLISPSGTTVELSSDNGGAGDNYGDPADTNCNSVTSFDMTASTSITTASAPFIGSFIPEGNFSTFNDGSNPNGVWTLQICDDAGADVGTLEYAELDFEVTATNCPPSYSQANGNLLTGTQSMDADFETDGIIESNQIIDANVIYDSGSQVELLSGFEVFVGRVFEAFIDGCGNLLRDHDITEKN